MCDANALHQHNITTCKDREHAPPTEGILMLVAVWPLIKTGQKRLAHNNTNQPTRKKKKKNARSLVRHTLYMRFCPIHIRSRSIAVVLPRATAVCATANGESSLIANNFSPLSTQHVFDVCSFVVICQNKYEIYTFTRCDLLTVFSTNSQSQIMSRDRSLDFPCHL